MRIATFNILSGRSPGDQHVDLARYAEAVASLDADVLALQEVDLHQPRSAGADLTAVAAEAMGAVDHRFVAALVGTPGEGWTEATGDERPGVTSYGIALLSRLPVHDWQVVRLGRPAVPVPVWWGGRPALVREEPRVAVAATVDHRGGRLTVVNAHLSFVPWWGRRQLRRLMRDVGDRSPLVLAGDLNLPPRPVERITGLRPLARALTFPAHSPGRQIDHVLARGTVGAVVSARAVRTAVSDHLALVVDLTDDLTR